MSLSEKLHTKTGKVITGLVSLLGLKIAADVSTSAVESYMAKTKKPAYVLQLTAEQLDSMQSKAYANNESRDYTKMGDKKLEAGEIDAALRLYLFAVEADPKDVRAQERLRVARNQAGGDQPVRNKIPGLDYQFTEVYDYSQEFVKDKRFESFNFQMKRQDRDLHFIFEDSLLYNSIGRFIEAKYKSNELGYVAFSDVIDDKVYVTVLSDGKGYIATMPISKQTHKRLFQLNQDLEP